MVLLKSSRFILKSSLNEMISLGHRALLEDTPILDMVLVANETLDEKFCCKEAKIKKVVFKGDFDQSYNHFDCNVAESYLEQEKLRDAYAIGGLEAVCP